jgi:hypothetical protein
MGQDRALPARHDSRKPPSLHREPIMANGIDTAV